MDNPYCSCKLTRESQFFPPFMWILRDFSLQV